MHHRDDADEAPEPITMTPAEFRQAARAGLRRLGLTYQQLAEQAHARDFTSRRHTNCGSPSEEQQDSTRRRWPRMVIEYESRKKKIGKKALRALKEFGEYSVGGAHLCRDLFPVPSLGREREGTGLNARCGNRWEQVREQVWPAVSLLPGTGGNR